MTAENVWANPGGTPGMPICKIEQGSEAWQHLQEAFNDTGATYVRISAAHGELKIKINEDIWTWPLNVERERDDNPKEQQGDRVAEHVDIIAEYWRD